MVGFHLFEGKWELVFMVDIYGYECALVTAL
jgi:hypothetical protein